ncbi:AbrB/MazE/SpoVT family DNA-binding domain-containing protein [Candidatus Micrarchaeota archaeon]|nr:AbrB/MazE/SpoVT family DNA-binding domain-containing protein [Candidatus Micrarchaeota archaeon]
MSSSKITRVDSKGRVIIPSGFRELLRLKPNSQVLISLDQNENNLIITPSAEKQLVLMSIGLSDAPGSLAKLAQVLAKEGVDLVTTESRAVSRAQNAEWLVTASAHSIKNVDEIRKKLLAAGATGFSSRKV